MTQAAGDNRYTFKASGVMDNGMTSKAGKVTVTAPSEQSAQGLARGELNRRCRKKGQTAPAKWILELVNVIDDGTAILSGEI